LITGDLIGPIVRQTFPVFPIEYVSSRTVVPSEGIETGPTTTPRPTLPPPPGATNTPTPTQTPAPPSPPIDFIASVNCQNGNVGFSWQPVAGATDYRVYQVGAKTLVDDSTSTSVNNGDDLGASQQRSYYVVAVNAGGESAPSNISTVMCGAGATDTPTPTLTPTNTRTPTSTPTNTPTPTDTLTPSPTTTPRPTRTLAPSPTACPITVCTPTPTLTGSLTPTATSAPQLWVIFEPGYPSRKTSGPNKQFWVKVRVMDPQGNPISTAAVTLVEPASYSGWSLAHLGNGVYGGTSGACFAGSTTTDVFVRVRATHVSYSPAEVDANTSANPPSSACP
jgi:hypothetical protein